MPLSDISNYIHQYQHTPLRLEAFSTLVMALLCVGLPKKQNKFGYGEKILFKINISIYKISLVTMKTKNMN
jgi:hypothetical protein